MRRIATQQPKARHWLVTALLSMFSDGVFKVALPPAERQPKERDGYAERSANVKRRRRDGRNLTLAHRGAFGTQPFVKESSRG